MTPSPATVPNALQLDALREVANVGCGHAANALSKLVGGRGVSINVPSVRMLAMQDLANAIAGGPRQKVVAATFTLDGALNGRLLMVLPALDAAALCALLLNKPGEVPLGEEQRGAFSEVANILASACLSAIGQLTKLRLLPSVPTIVQSTVEAVVRDVRREDEQPDSAVVMLEAQFATLENPPIAGQLLVLPDDVSLRNLLARLGVETKKAGDPK